MRYRKNVFALLLFMIVVDGISYAQQTVKRPNVSPDPLPSWIDGPVKTRILTFINNTTTEGHKDFVPVTDRVACFDNDGTLWAEQPIYFQFAFAIDRVKALAPKFPEWKTTQPFQALLQGDLKTALSGGEKSLMQIVLATHSGLSTDEFEVIVKDWLKTAKHPKTGRHYDKMVYKPMIELLAYLRSKGYKTFIVSGGGVDFMRVFSEDVYGIPPNQVVGSSGKVAYEVNNGTPILKKLPELNYYDDKEGKPVAIYQLIGKRPIFTAGNSDGDYAMLEWTTTGNGPRFGMIVHHTDAAREWAYDRNSPIGRLKRGLDDAPKKNWLIVDMKNNWKEIYGK